MNLKKLSISEQFPRPRRKVLSGFGFGVGISLIVFALLSLSHFLKGPSGEPMFQGFQSIRMHSPGNSTSSSATSELQNSEDLVYKFENGSFMDKTQLENASEIHLNQNLEGFDGKGAVLKTTQFSNFSEQVKNASFTVDEGPVVKQKGTPSDSHGEGFVLDQKAYPGNSSKIVENVSFSGKEDVAIGKTISGISLQNYSNGEKEAKGNIIVSNVSYNGEVGYTSGEEEKVLGNKTIFVNVTSQVKKMKSHSYEDCDIFDGKWVRDDSKPYYPGGSCPYIDADFDCHLNRRPDDGYVKWKWQPNGCNIPRQDLYFHIQLLFNLY